MVAPVGAGWLLGGRRPHSHAGRAALPECTRECATRVRSSCQSACRTPCARGRGAPLVAAAGARGRKRSPAEAPPTVGEVWRRRGLCCCAGGRAQPGTSRALGPARRARARSALGGCWARPARTPSERLWILLCDSRLGLWRKRRPHSVHGTAARVDAPMRGQVGLIGEAFPHSGHWKGRRPVCTRGGGRSGWACGGSACWRAVGTLERAVDGVPRPGRAAVTLCAGRGPGPWPPPPAPATWTRLCVTSWSHWSEAAATVAADEGPGLGAGGGSAAMGPQLLSPPEASLTAGQAAGPLAAEWARRCRTRATQPREAVPAQVAGKAQVWGGGVHGPGSAMPRKGRGVKRRPHSGHGRGRRPGSAGHEARGPPSRGSASDSGHSDEPRPRGWPPDWAAAGAMTSALGAPSPGSGATPEGPERSRGWTGPMATGPCSDVPASVLPLLRVERHSHAENHTTCTPSALPAVDPRGTCPLHSSSPGIRTTRLPLLLPSYYVISILGFYTKWICC